ncbi:MAG: ABC transporter permease [Candidatus Limnocylindrales bacterium]|jgi:peptide/nickel transport system permease protein
MDEIGHPRIVETPADLEEVLADNPDYEVQLESLNQRQLAWRRFKRHRMALLGAILFTSMVVVGVVGPILLPFDKNVFVPLDQLNSNGRPPMLVPYFHPFGETQQLQYDVLTLVVNGIGLSLMISVGATVISTMIGTVVGGMSGYFGGWLDTILMRFVDALLALPLIYLILVFSEFLGGGNWFTIMVIFALLGWLQTARLVRSVILSLRGEDYVDAARVAGVSELRIIFRHLLPNALSPIIVAATLSIAAFITAEAFVSFVGYGIDPSTPTLGNILSGSQQAIGSGNWWWAVFPGLAIVLIVLGINFMGDGLQDALDPRAKI